jgi:hypothetical protein
MIIKHILSCALLLMSFSGMAQLSKIATEREDFFRFGAKVGVNINKITGQSYKTGFNYNYQLGGFLQFNFSKHFGIQPEINFVQSSSAFTNDATEVYDDLFREGSQKKSKLDRLEIPLLLNINIGESKRVKLQFGPAYGAVLKQTVDSLVTGGNIYKNNDWSAIGGIWFQLPLVNLGARYKLGFTNINAIDNRETWKNQAIQIFAGVTF